MTRIQIRTDEREPIVAHDHLLDLFASAPRSSTIHCKPDFFKGMEVSSVARELFVIAAAVYCADKIVLRRPTQDAWTRDLEFYIEVDNPDMWNDVKTDLEPMLSFLSGDQYSFTFRRRPQRAVPRSNVKRRKPPVPPRNADGVCLFSGGLDSLTGAIDLLASGKKLLLAGHHDSPLAENRQRALFTELVSAFGDDKVERRSLYLRPRAAHPDQAHPLPPGARENTSRSRSFLFVAAAVAAASAMGPGVPVYMPENGFIGVNVPLTAARSGSLSTRTTHPLYVDYFGRLLAKLGLDHAIANPFRLKTKGELLAECADPNLLQALATKSVSCSHPEIKRFYQSPYNNCGTCYPCLIRRAAMHHTGWDGNDYVLDALGADAPLLLEPNRIVGASLRALAKSLSASHVERPGDVIANGRIPNGETLAFFGVWQRGRDELRTWLDTSTNAALRRRYA